MWNRSGYSSYQVHRLDLFNFVDMDRRACRLFAVHVGVDVHLGHQRLTMFEVGKDSAADAKRCLRMEHPSVDSFSKHHNLLSKVSVSSAHAARRLMQNTYHCRDCHFLTATRAAAFAALPNVNAGRGCAAAAFVAPPKGRPRLFLAPAPRVSAGHEAVAHALQPPPPQPRARRHKQRIGGRWTLYSAFRCEHRAEVK